MAQVIEPLSGGLVTAVSSALLAPGQLTQTLNAVYRPDSTALYRAPGRTLLGDNGAGAGAPAGLVTAQFDNGNAYLLTYCNAALRRSTTGYATPFSNIGSPQPGNYITGTHFRDKFYLFFGGLERFWVLRNNGTIRQAGLDPVVSGPDYRVENVTNAWQDAVASYYEYWTTEVAEIVENGSTTVLESDFDITRATPANVFVQDDDRAVVITRPQLTNANATRWRIYRSEAKAAAKPMVFPIGVLVGDLDITTSEFSDRSAQSAANSTGPTHVSGTFTNPNNVQTSNDTRATQVLGSPGVTASNIYGTFGFTGIVDPITGIQVIVEARANVTGTPYQLSIELSKDAGTTYPATKTITISSGSDKTFTLGGIYDQWVPGPNITSHPNYVPTLWDTDAFTNTNFRMRVTVKNVAVSGSVTAEIDFISMIVYHGGNADVGNKIYPAISLNINGEESRSGANGPPPAASLGAVFEDHLVTNDVRYPSFIRWSLPGEPESFPDLYFLDLETDYNDIVTSLATLNNKLLVATAQHIYRMNYLPTEIDASFSRGRVLDMVDGVHGCVGPNATALYRGHNGITLRAYVSRAGVIGTDGFTTWPLMPQIAWAKLIATAGITFTALVNNPETWELLLYYAPLGGSNITRRLHLSYHPSHIGSGRTLKVSGPVVAENTSTNVVAAAGAQMPNGAFRVWTNYANREIWYDDTTALIPHTDKYMDIRTRKMYLSNMGNEWKLNSLHTYFEYLNTTSGVNITPTVSKTNAADVTLSSKAVVPTFTGLYRTLFGTTTAAESLSLRIHETANTGNDNLGVLQVVIGGESFGHEDSRA